MSHFGEHVTYDGYHADPSRLDSRQVVAAALSDLTVELEMTILGGPDVHYAPSTNGKDPGGWTGAVILQESHITIHTFPGRGFVSADVYTCQDGIDVDGIRAFFRRTFGASDDEVNHLLRGRCYPDHDLHPDVVRDSMPAVGSSGP